MGWYYFVDERNVPMDAWASVHQAAEILGKSRNFVYGLIDRQTIRSMVVSDSRSDQRTLVPVRDILHVRDCTGVLRCIPDR